MEALILIDVQKGFLKNSLGKRNNLQAEENMLKILEKFRNKNKKVIHIQHFSRDEKGLLFKEEDREFQKGFEPLKNEVIFKKTVNSAFIGTGLEKYLKDNSIDTLFIVGVSLPHCVSTTVRMASNLGFDITLIEDATISFEITDYFTGEKLSPEEVHRYNISTLNEEFCKVINTEKFFNNY
ncbi:cysteine hydrolase [Fusobacterium polymorphum]|uniref:Cysteine hydrolase n=1 Tax=Fusobacterium nucleatum subsp. polymorphum TaxID=76857 RepID=A0A2C6BW38_FUSNP|nr:cysteine hydrolase family protein [Fusobacterium polymorphum]PHI08451.1 cysteine hydrolase [Fusobacterium polymorphum]PHI15872.1 cysteine hydrolase [Fusobacterium polymorphum]